MNFEVKLLYLIFRIMTISSLTDHMYIEEYIEEDEEPPLLLYSCPSHGKGFL